ncbi:HTH-type transcriptional regulator BetI [Mycobacterium shottsii]|uniref:TetR family transcriptional regulator n=1 Tax=Mycobacterium shottsii TaxID=133549 RepID=A0A7I7LJ80_9MYCO|nr:TetR family transcriptional regulator [Mycobacterium shottsii]QYL29226.1 HTH-type transcriptional regulator BetI [Mycobacterium shottsii]BBX59453.1 TetR family transcriptional regulator [Mycobacterium shottsii]
MGRRRGNLDTRNAIVTTARRLFAESGYEQTSVRDIASAAGVDPALIRHYFGSKAKLFRSIVGWPFEADAMSALILSGDRDELGARLTRVFLEAWERPESRSPLLAILRGAATHEESTTLVRQFFQDQMYPQLAQPLPGPDTELRIDLAMAQLLGIAYLRHVLRLEPIASTPLEEVVARVTPTIIAHLEPSQLDKAADR